MTDNFECVSDYDHPIDLSFTKDINAGKRVSGAGYASEKQFPDESDNNDSISLSEESIARKIDQLRESNENPFDEQPRDPKVVRKESKWNQSVEL